MKLKLALPSKFQELNLSGNEIDADTAKQLINIVKAIKSLKKFSLGTNNFGSQFDGLTEFASGFNFVDLGDEDDDQGSLDGDEEDDVEEEEEESEEELDKSENDESVSSLNAESMLDGFLKNPTLGMFQKIEEERLKMIDYFDVRGLFSHSFRICLIFYVNADFQDLFHT